MPGKSGSSGILSQLGDKARKAIISHRNDPTTYGNEGLPAGIELGIAKLTECRFGEIKKEGPNKGKPNFYMAGVILEPKEFNGVKLEGRTTSQSINLIDGPNTTVDKQVARVLNLFRQFGVDTGEFDSDEDLIAAAAALKEAAPTFKFRTWKGDPTPQFPNPRVNEQWNGLTEYNGEATSAVEDGTAEESADVTEQEAESETAEDFPDDDALDALAEKADKKDKASQKELEGLAEKAGCDSDAVSAAADWAAVADLIKTARAGGEAADDKETESGYTPERGDIVLYQAPKTKKAAQCEVTAVFAKKETVHLKRLDDHQAFKDVAWSELEADK